MKENINYKILYRILRQYSYNRNMEAMNIQISYLQLIIPQYFISNKSGIWSLSLIVHSKG